MLEIFRKSKFASLVVLLILPLAVFGQDLGSSSGLFTNPKAKSAPRKNAKPKTAVSRKPTPKPEIARTARTKTPVKTKSAPKTAQVVVNQNQKQQTPVPPTNLIITVGDKTNGDYEEFFERAIEEGNSARDARQYTKAEAAYLRAQSIKIKDSRAIYGLGNLYSDQQRWEEAERAYRTAIAIEPTAPEAYIALSFVLTQPIIGENLSNRYVEAEKLARKAIEIDQRNALAYDQLGVALELQGKISSETHSAYRRAIELEPNFALAYAHLGRLLGKTGKANESNAAYRNAMQYATDAPTMILVADVLQSQQKYVESEQLLRRALEEDERNPTALVLLGRALTTRGSYEEAEKILKKSAEVSPNSFVSYTLLGSMFVRREKYEDAEDYLLKAARVVSPNEKKRLAQEFEVLGDKFLRAGKNKDAVRAFRQALTLDKEKLTLANKLAKAKEN